MLINRGGTDLSASTDEPRKPHGPSAPRRRLAWTAVLTTACLAVATSASAERIVLNPGSTQIRFNLDSTLHRVEGTAAMVSGEIDFPPQGGTATGRIVVDARSIETGNGLRDSTMHGKVLESERYPKIELMPERIEAEGPDANGEWAVTLFGTMRIHGRDEPIAIPSHITVDGDRAHVRGAFTIPYVDWGFRDMSNFLLTVEKEVHVEFETSGLITPHPVGPTAAVPTTALGAANPELPGRSR